MNTITVVFNTGSRRVTAPPLYQWDYGQVLFLEGIELPESYEVHFSNKPEGGQAEVRIGTGAGVVIPDQVLETGEPIYAFLFLHSDIDDGETLYIVNIPVRKRPKPFYTTPTSSQQSLITETIAALNAAVQTAESAAQATAADAQTAAGYAEAAAVSADAASHHNTTQRKRRLPRRLPQVTLSMRNATRQSLRSRHPFPQTALVHTRKTPEQARTRRRHQPISHRRLRQISDRWLRTPWTRQKEAETLKVIRGLCLPHPFQGAVLSAGQTTAVW